MPPPSFPKVKRNVRMSLPSGWDKENSEENIFPSRSHSTLTNGSEKVKALVNQQQENHSQRKLNPRHSTAAIINTSSSRLSLSSTDQKRRKSVSFAEATEVRLYAKNADSNHTLDLDKQLLNDHKKQQNQQQKQHQEEQHQQVIEHQQQQEKMEQNTQHKEPEQSKTDAVVTTSLPSAEEKESIPVSFVSVDLSPALTVDLPYAEDVAADEIAQAVEMEMTRVFGSIYDQSEQSAPENDEENGAEDLSMEMTGIVGAGILSTISPARVFIRRSIGGAASSEETSPKQEVPEEGEDLLSKQRDSMSSFNASLEESSQIPIPLAGEAEVEADATMELTRCFGSILPIQHTVPASTNSADPVIAEQSEMEMDMEMTGLIPVQPSGENSAEKENQKKVEEPFLNELSHTLTPPQLITPVIANSPASTVLQPNPAPGRRVSHRLSLTLSKSKTVAKSKRNSFQPISPDIQPIKPAPVVEEMHPSETEGLENTAETKEVETNSSVFPFRSSLSSVLGEETAMLGAKWAAIIGVGGNIPPSRSTLERASLNSTIAIANDNAYTGMLSNSTGMGEETSMINEMFKRVLIGGESPGRALAEIKSKFNSKDTSNTKEEAEEEKIGGTLAEIEETEVDDEEEEEKKETARGVEEETKEELTLIASDLKSNIAVEADDDEEEEEITFSFPRRDSAVQPKEEAQNDVKFDQEDESGAAELNSSEVTTGFLDSTCSVQDSTPPPSISRMATFLSAVGLSALDDEATNSAALRRNRRDSSFAPPIPSRESNGEGESESALSSIYALTTCSEIEDYQSACLHLIESNASMKEAMTQVQDNLDSNPPPVIQFFLQHQLELDSPTQMLQRTSFTNTLSLLNQRCLSESKLVWAEWRLQVLGCCQTSFLRHLAAIEGDDATIAEMKQMLNTLRDEASKRENSSMREMRNRIIQLRKEKEIAREKNERLQKERDAKFAELNGLTVSCTSLSGEADRISLALVNRSASFNRLLSTVEVAPYFHHLTGLQPLVVTSNQLKLAIHSLFSLDVHFDHDQQQQSEGVIKIEPQLNLLTLAGRTNGIESASLNFPFVLSTFHEHSRPSILSLLSSYRNLPKRSVHQLVLSLSQRLGRLIEWAKRIGEISKKFTVQFAKTPKTPAIPPDSFSSNPFNFRIIISSSRMPLQTVIELGADLSSSSVDSTGITVGRIRVISENRSSAEDEVTRTAVLADLQTSRLPLHHILEQLQHRLDK